MRYIYIILFLFLASNTYAQNNALLKELDYVLDNEAQYTTKKEARLDSLKKEVKKHTTKGKEWERYQIFQELANEYSAYKFDSAFHYAKKAIDLAYQIHNKNAVAFTKSEFGHLLVSVGLHNEALDTLHTVQVEFLTPIQLQNHYSYLVRCHYDLADFINDEFYSAQYRQLAEAYVDSVLKYQQKGTNKPALTKALRFLAQWKPDSASYYYNYVLNEVPSSMHEKAMAHSCMGYIEIREGRKSLGRDHLINSVIADVKTSTKEAISLIVLANYLFENGDTERAYNYILRAQNDAEFFGSKQRLLQVSEVLPKIEGAQLLATKKKKEKATRFLWVLSTITLAVVLFLVIVYRQLFNLQKIWNTINQQNKELTKLNQELQEANKIKERYIGHFFNTSSMYINKLETLSKSLNALLINNNPQKLKTILRSITPKKERDSLFHDFDEVFLSLFPTFIADVDDLLDEDKRYVLKSDQLLNTELRILALIRLGIDQNETMSQVLGVSINTIYTYKTKAQNRSSLPTDEFFEHLNSIKSK